MKGRRMINCRKVDNPLSTLLLGLTFLLLSHCISSFTVVPLYYSSSTCISSSTGIIDNNNDGSQLFLSASLEEGEDLIFYGATTKSKKKKKKVDEEEKPPVPTVQRVYETWEWNYEKNNKTYNINYRVEGKEDGIPILLVHGFGANINHFRYQFPSLVQAGYRVYAIDLLGFGASDKPADAATTGFSIELFAQQIIDFISYINEKENTKQHSWVLSGNSIGGLCCLVVAASMEQDVTIKDKFDISSIVLFNTSGGMTGFRYEDVPFWARPILAFFQKVVLGPTIGGYFFRNFRTRENIERILMESGVYGDTTNVNEELFDILLSPADDDNAEQVFLAVFGGPAGPTAESVLPNVKIPVLALWGGNDPWTPVDAGLHPGNILPPYHGTGEFILDVLPGAGHCPHDECPDIVNMKMIEFIKKIEASSAK